MKTRNKKAVSELIATVLIVAVTIAAFVLVYNYVIPLIKGGMETSKACSDIQMTINTEKGYTNYDTITKDVSVMVSRGAKEGDLTAIQIKISDDTGNSKTVKKDTTLGPNEEETFAVLAAGADGHGLTGTPTTVAVAAVVKIGAKDTLCDLTPEASLTEKTA